MTNDKTPCQYCGEEYSSQGVHAHERHCDENPENQDDEDETAAADEGGDSVFATSVNDDADLTEVEEVVRDRADGDCENCGEDYETFHRIYPDEPEATSNLFALCGDCEAELEDLHPLTKRSKVRHEE